MSLTAPSRARQQDTTAPPRRSNLQVTTHEKVLLTLYRSVDDATRDRIDAIAADGWDRPFTDAILREMKATGIGKLTPDVAVIPFLAAKRRNTQHGRGGAR